MVSPVRRSVGPKKPSRRYRSIRSCLLFVFVGNLLRTHTDNEWERESYGAMAIFPLASFRVARDWPDEKLHENSVFDFGGSDLQCWFCRRASELQENRPELSHERQY